MASRSIDDLRPALAYAFGKAEAEYKAQYPDYPIPFLTATYRSDDEQEQLFKQRPKVTNARAGQSPHNFNPSLAFDIAFKIKTGAVTYAEKWFDLFAPFLLRQPNITWGGNFKSLPDKPHFELTNWKVLAKG